LKKAGEILSAFLDKDALKDAEQMGKLFSPSVWSDLLGRCNLSQGASHSRIAELEKSVLLVEADHPGWIQLLQTKQTELLNAVRRRFPEITFSGISFRLIRQ
jgi:predicted nucleic acid-binding Zn ribbon protein